MTTALSLLFYSHFRLSASLCLSAIIVFLSHQAFLFVHTTVFLIGSVIPSEPPLLLRVVETQPES